MIHKIAPTSPGQITPGGNQVCVCGQVLSPGGILPHLYEVVALLTEETELLRRHIIALDKARSLSGGIVDEDGKRLF